VDKPAYKIDDDHDEEYEASDFILLLHHFVIL
jgi:hypothetical protein